MKKFWVIMGSLVFTALLALRNELRFFLRSHFSENIFGWNAHLFSDGAGGARVVAGDQIGRELFIFQKPDDIGGMRLQRVLQRE